jgi:DNA-binding MarR family transcriptional regulator
LSPATTAARGARTAGASNTRRDELADALFGLIGGLKRRLMASVPDELRSEFGAVTWHQVGALEQLRAAMQTSSGATMNEIAQMQQCALSSASALVDRMIRLGFAERRNDPEDRRIIHIAPTALGEQMLEKFDDARKTVALKALAPLSDADLEMLIALMSKVVDWPEPGHPREAAHD